MLLLTNQMRGMPESLKFPWYFIFETRFLTSPHFKLLIHHWFTGFQPTVYLSLSDAKYSSWWNLYGDLTDFLWFSPRLPLYLSYLIQGTLGILMITQRKTGDQPHLLVASFWSRLKIFNRRDFTCFSQPGEVCLTLYVLINVSIWATAPLPHPWPTLTLTWYRGLVLRYWNWSRSFHKGAKLVWLM